MSKIIIYTDGACTGNPGHGGYGVVMKKGELRKELSEGYRYTTNNRMEMTAIIVALQNIKDGSVPIEIYTDSRLIVDAIEKDWLGGWKRRGWRKADKSHVMNADLWIRIDGLMAGKSIRLNWVKGHAGIEENERCDELATDAAENTPFKTDNVYESDHKPPRYILTSYENKLVAEGKIKPIDKKVVSISNSASDINDSLELGRIRVTAEVRDDGKFVVSLGSKKFPVLDANQVKELGKWLISQSEI